MLKKLIVGLAAAALCAGFATAQMEPAPEAPQEIEQKPLKVGDKAPLLSDVTWLKGEPVSTWESGQIYVLDFWATWCGPCIATMPHVNDLQNQYREQGVNVIGVAIWPRPGMTPTDKFVKDRGDAISYRIAEDVGGKTASTFMDAAGQNGIPTIMVIDREGMLAWMGRPNAVDKVLASVVKGDFDPVAFAEEQKRVRETMMRLGEKFREAWVADDWGAIVDVSGEMLALDEKQFGQFGIWKYVGLVKDGRGDEAKKWAAQLASTLYADDANALNEFAWKIVGPGSELTEEEVDKALGLRIAERANDVAKGKDASILDTLARAHFILGHLEKAVEFQEKAVDIADPRMAEQLKNVLEDYRRAASQG